jgi:hypothetical protein
VEVISVIGCSASEQENSASANANESEVNFFNEVILKSTNLEIKEFKRQGGNYFKANDEFL